jgi:hypothetical protein
MIGGTDKRAKDVSSYAQSTNGDYSPVSMLKQSAAATATPPGNTDGAACGITK